MIRYLANPPTQDYPGVRLVHNFYPGREGYTGEDRPAGADGFRYWITDEPNPNERRCFCGWLDGREHYGTVRVVDACRWCGKQPWTLVEGEGQHVCCDDHWFSEYGDMLTADELRRLSLTDPENRVCRDSWLEYRIKRSRAAT